MNKWKNNQVTITGEIISDFQYSHEFYGEKFYMVNIKVQRISDSFDILPVMVTDRMFDFPYNCIGLKAKVTGQYRSYNKSEENKRKLFLSIFARDFEILKETEFINKNEIFLDGYICAEPTYRKTPLGREIADILLAVNRSYGKSDYIPCICWGRNARYASKLEIGQRCEIYGRVQSREYQKILYDDITETRVAYEVSVYRLEVPVYE